jgi:hypothetical protein
MTMSVQCRRCGHVFETAAKTNTRCRRCRTVVNIGRAAVHRETVVDRRALTEVPNRPGMEGASPLVIGAAMSIAGACALWHGLSLRPGQGADEKSVRRSRRRWYVIGAITLCAGGVLVAKCASAETAQ